jgi:preprotein translocase subunit YajC
MSSSTLLIVMVVMMGAMFMMTRSAKKKQAAASEMRNKMEPGSGVRTNDDSVELEVAPGVHAIYAKSAVAVVLDGAEYNRIVHGDEPEDDEIDGEAGELAADEAEAPIVLDKAPSLEKSLDAPADEVAGKDEEAAEEPAADNGVSAK